MLQTEGNNAEHSLYSVKERDLSPERKKQSTANESLFGVLCQDVPKLLHCSAS